MKKFIFIDGKEIEYELIFKKVKNINFRIRRDGKISVSASKRVPMKSIEDFLERRSDFIISALDKFSSLKTHSFIYDDGDELMILGKTYIAKNEISRANRAEISGDNTVTIYTVDNSQESRRKAVMRLYESVCDNEILPLCAKVFETVKSAHPIMPEIKFRKTKSRWGSCYSRGNKIVLNKLLATVPKDCVTYVIYHEFIHFPHPNHSSNFYSELEKYLPEHRALRKKLNSYAYVLDFPSER